LGFQFWYLIGCWACLPALWAWSVLSTEGEWFRWDDQAQAWRPVR
jgi:hypothetical protein